MKWIVLPTLAICLFIFWPRDPSPTSPSSSQKALSTRSHSSIQRSRTNRRDPYRKLSEISKEDLQNQILAQWPTIDATLPGREAGVVKFIRALRELGKRDGRDALTFLDQLDRTEKKGAWIYARLAVVGGWSLSEPEAAARALRQKDDVLPEAFRTQTQSLPTRTLAVHYQSVTRLARQVFDRWAEHAPDEIAQAASGALLVAGSSWGSSIEEQFHAAAGTFATNNRNSIDAILNNPQRVAIVPNIHQRRPTEEMENLGEPALTQEEWAARNPELAREMISSASASEEGSTFSHVRELPSVADKYGDLVGFTPLIRGLARVEDNYEDLIALAPPAQRLRLAKFLTMNSSSNYQEMAWLLDGRETTWTLTSEQRQEAVAKLLESTVLTVDEREALANFSLPPSPGAFSRPSTGIELEVVPELPNKQAE